MIRSLTLAAAVLAASTLAAGTIVAGESVKLGFTYPQTGPYAVQGLDQLQAATMAVEELNAKGGILGRPVELLARDTQSKPDVAKTHLAELIDQHKVAMIFGGSESNVAVATNQVCQEKGVVYMATLTYSTETTGEKGRRHTFRECYDSWAAAKVLSDYMTRTFPGKRYVYLTADYGWGHTTEASFRQFTGSTDAAIHRGTKTRFPGATEEDHRRAVAFAKLAKPEVLVVVQFGNDMVMSLRQIHAAGLKQQAQVVVPNLTLGMAEGAGPEVMEGVIGALPWAWSIAFERKWAGGMAFAEAFAKRYQRWPCTSGASAYVNVLEFAAAAERAKSLEAPAIIRALEGHRYTRLKDEQQWRDFDHQSIQTVFAVRCKPAAEVAKDRFTQDFFSVIAEMSGAQAFKTREEWNAARTAAGVPTWLDRLPGE